MKQTVGLLFLLFSLHSFGQTATIKVQKVFPSAEQTENYIKFEINGQSFGEKDSIISIQINQRGFDSCKAIINTKTLTFVTKLRANETYEIKQGCCCAAFTLEAQKNPKRGTVLFKNKTNRDLGLIVAEANIDTIHAGKRKVTFASESAMCYFKPCSILVTESAYMSAKYDYQTDDRDYDQLWKEQEKFIIGETWFHFLHGEKIEVFLNPANHTLELKFRGYLSQKEYQKALPAYYYTE